MDNNKHDAKSPESEATAIIVSPETTDDTPATSASSTESQTAKATPSTAPSQTPASSRSSWAIRFGVLLALGLTACTLGGGFMLYQQMQQQLLAQDAKNIALQDQLQQALLQPNQRIGQLEQQQLNDAKTYQELTKLAADQNQLQDRVNKLAQRSPTHWMASEAEYLVNMAGRKLWLEKDPRTATDLLKSADETIAAMNNPALLPIRKALAKDIAATASIKTTDIDGNVLALDALIEQLDKLPLNRTDAEADAPEDTTITGDLNDWQSNLGKTWKALTQDFITIRHKTADAPALLAPEQQWYLVENIRHKLLQSQLALYRYDRAAYHQSLMMARKWLQTYFDTQDHKTAEAIAEIDKLATLELDPITLKSFAAKPLLLQLTSYGELTSSEDAPL
ncbi:uroporphyrinogen-III methylase [Shewanella baltica]|uniref:uroporphyrinogen-III C-methyltransferase n=1 Tax=Shewanella baltica TaxID=62322 RepID=UPI00217E7EC7|nr:uroporphyrinogen-III C-methyltransferase [Shewanella baltica]MCS6126926.1 uroporphyrinogen-III methylase [Shewanella baltica]MCS6139274.1 uroporphyrinogen-III methylase [Shewanella baltica]MCS6145414.1 uroporphyrinogen-III methylase [Shewanella baltica]MCS6169944.1 uroporphyrinogen-III methylase [Shewanella baltica]MCS6187168.1 uroporphyrinogen-III methylase [Shewanella baltica]